MLPLSVILITKNEANDIERCLRPLQSAQEIIVLDSGSSDGTVELARSLGARVIETDWPGFGPQKNRALDVASLAWVFSIDADEWPDQALLQSIGAAVLSGLHDPSAPVAYRVKRLNLYRGKPITHGDWGRDRPLRLFRKSAGRFSEALVHESVQVQGAVALLDGLLWHDSIADYAEGDRKYRRYAELAAQELAKKGRGGLLSGLSHGFFALLRSYLFRLGFLDGLSGLQLAWLGARYTFFKYFLARPKR
jgi:glycosyltransferase involved in cell wall biosynthesis